MRSLILGQIFGWITKEEKHEKCKNAPFLSSISHFAWKGTGTENEFYKI
jgi:hypothetical protein